MKTLLVLILTLSSLATATLPTTSYFCPPDSDDYSDDCHHY